MRIGLAAFSAAGLFLRSFLDKVHKIIMLPFVLGSIETFAFVMPSMSAMAGIFHLSLFGTYLAFIIYYNLLEHCGSTAISMVACFFPVVGMFLGYLFLGEALTLGGLFSAGLILIGMLIVNEVISFKTARSPSSQQEI